MSRLERDPVTRYVEENLGLAHRIARSRIARGLPRTVSPEDIIAAAEDGLLDATKRHNPEKGSFTAFVIARIKGSIIDKLRATSENSRMDAKLRKQAQDAAYILAVQCGCDVYWASPEVAGHLGVDFETLRQIEVRWVNTEWTDLYAQDYLGIDALKKDYLEECAMSTHNQAKNTLDMLLQKEDLARLEQALATLEERERIIYELYYRKELTLKEIGEQLGVTESRISQITTKILIKLQTYFGCVMAEKKEVEKKGPLSKTDEEIHEILSHGYEFLRQVDSGCTKVTHKSFKARDFVLDKINRLYSVLQADLQALEGGKLDLAYLQANFASLRWLMLLTRFEVSTILANEVFGDSLEVKDLDRLPAELDSELKKRAEGLIQTCKDSGKFRITKKWMTEKDGEVRRANALVMWITQRKDYEGLLWLTLQKICLLNGIELTLVNKDIPRTEREDYKVRELELKTKRFPLLLAEMQEAKVTRVTQASLQVNKGNLKTGSALAAWISRQEESVGEKLWEKLAVLCSENGIEFGKGDNIKKDSETRIKVFLDKVAGFKGPWTPTLATTGLPKKTLEDVSAKFGGSARAWKWSRILKLLPQKVADNFDFIGGHAELLSKDEEERALYLKCRKRKIRQVLLDLLESQKPSTFNLRWIRENDKSEKVLGLMGQIKRWEPSYHWADLVACLDKEWAEKFTFRAPSQTNPQQRSGLSVAS